jgi:hypothetical protein
MDEDLRGGVKVASRVYVMSLPKIFSSNNVYGTAFEQWKRNCPRCSQPFNLRVPAPYRFLIPEAVAYKNRFCRLFESTDLEANSITDLKSVSNIVFTLWEFLPLEVMFFKNGKLNRFDITNTVKLIEDAYFEYLFGKGNRSDDDRLSSDFTVRKRILSNLKQPLIQLEVEFYRDCNWEMI